MNGRNSVATTTTKSVATSQSAKQQNISQHILKTKILENLKIRN